MEEMYPNLKSLQRILSRKFPEMTTQPTSATSLRSKTGLDTKLLFTLSMIAMIKYLLKVRKTCTVDCMK